MARDYQDHVEKLCRNRGLPQPADNAAAFFGPAHELPVVPADQVPVGCQGEGGGGGGETEPPGHVYVYLRGAHTSFGIGVLHDVRAAVQLKYGGLQGPDGEDLLVRSTEVVVLDPPSMKKAHDHTFSGKGDEGAPVRLADGRVLGFLLGRDPGHAARPASYVSVADTLLQDIRQSLGADEVQLVSCEAARQSVASA